MATSGERLARVSYLPGARRSSDSAASAPSPDLLAAELESVAESTARAEKLSMSALARRGMSSAEMERLLCAHDLEENVVLNEIARLEGVGLLDDSELAQTLMRTLRERKGLGRSAIAAELRRRQIGAAIIEETIEAGQEHDEFARARELALKRAPQLRSLDAVTARRRLSAFLMRKGYSGGAVSAAVTAALEPSNGPRFR